MSRLLVLVALAALLLLSACGGSSSQPGGSPPPDAAPSMASLRSAANVAATGQPVGYRVCAEWHDWQRLSMDEMAPVFADKRFQIDGRVHPVDFGIYLSNFNFVAAPTANSANKDVVAFTGMATSFGQKPPAIRCDETELPRVLGSWVELWIAGHRILDLRRDGGRLVAVVEPAATVFQQVALPYPVPLSPQPLDVDLLQFIDTSGRQLYETRLISAGWTWQMGDDDRLTFALLSSGHDTVTEPLPLGGPRLRFFSYLAQNGPPNTAGAIAVLDNTGVEVAKTSWSQPPAAWHVLLEIELPPGSYRVRLEGAAAGGLLVLPADTPLPDTTATTLTATNVIEFTPSGTPATVVDGSCFGRSLAVQRPVAMRCIAGSIIWDPCFGEPDATVVTCVKDPTRPEAAVGLRLEAPLRGLNPAWDVPDPRAWTVETMNGSLCQLLQGTSTVINGERVNYSCTDGSAIIGVPAPGAIWTARRIAGAGMPPAGTTPPEEVVPLRTVWR